MDSVPFASPPAPSKPPCHPGVPGPGFLSLPQPALHLLPVPVTPPFWSQALAWWDESSLQRGGRAGSCLLASLALTFPLLRLRCGESGTHLREPFPSAELSS
ncbi:unnamed protein product [Rangifer tarandus platyrhynchus]|uniref:Uncharacterized protein n=2 Tax=Rangifer tarandus platyrhynchus TaxID=3082113 RepID=A0ABN8ZV78_RANTA|nr:unnamed protein product [Rangifer tarandus platyrhynchus]